MSAAPKAQGCAPREQAPLGFFPSYGVTADDLAETLRRLGVAPGDAIMAAVSGGADSVALLCLLGSALAGSGSRLLAAHLDHGVRGPQSAEDAASVARLCARRGVPLTVGRLSAEDVRAARRRAGSLEGGLRELRYRFLAEAARRHGARWVVTGHQRDDQAETVLFRCLRGMDWRSLAGIPEARGAFLRPLLCWPRAALERVCSVEGETPVDDVTNRDTAHARNRIRHGVLPLLGRAFSPDTAGLLGRMSAAAAALRRWEQSALLASGIPFGEVRGEGVPVASLRRLPAPLLAGALLEMISSAGLCRTPGRRALAAAERMATEATEGVVALPGGAARFEGGRLRILSARTSRGQEERSANEPGARVSVSVRMSMETFDGESLPRGPDRVLLARSAIRLPLVVRARERGDRFEPLGLGREKSLKEYLIDRKVPRARRPHIPLVVDGSGRILWIVGVQIAHWARLIPGVPCEALLLEAVGPHEQGAAGETGCQR